MAAVDGAAASGAAIRSPHCCEEPVQVCGVPTADLRDPLNPEHKYLLLNRFKEVNWAGMYMVELHL